MLSGGGANAGSADRTPESGPRTSVCDAVSAAPAPAAAPTATAAFVDDDGFVAGATLAMLRKGQPLIYLEHRLKSQLRLPGSPQTNHCVISQRYAALTLRSIGLSY